MGASKAIQRALLGHSKMGVIYERWVLFTLSLGHLPIQLNISTTEGSRYNYRHTSGYCVHGHFSIYNDQP